MHFSVVNVEIERAVRSQYTPSFEKPRFQKTKIVIEYIGEPLRSQGNRPVTVALEPHAFTVYCANCPQLCPLLYLACVERRVNVDQVDRC